MPLTGIAPQDSSLPPDIQNPAVGAAPTNIQGFLPVQTVGGSSASSGSGPGLLTETAPMSTSTSISRPTSMSTPTPITISITPSATPTQTPAAASGMSPGRLIAAIVIPIGVLAIIIPIITYWFLTHKRKLQEQRYANQRTSHSHEPMIQKHSFYRPPPPPPPNPLQRTLSERYSPHGNLREPTSAQTRNSLGLFNFELSPNTPTSPPESQESELSPRFRFSIARALEMRRSQPSIVRPPARTSDTGVSRYDTNRPRTRGSNRNSRTSPFEPPPPYAPSQSSSSPGARSHFAPLSRIGSHHLAKHSPPPPANRRPDAAEPDRSTYASSDVIRDPNSYGHVHMRSSSPSLEWPSPPPTRGIVARKPVPTHSPPITSQDTSPQNASSHLAGPFSSHLPERVSDVSGLSIDTSRWEDERPRQESMISSMGSQVYGDESSTIHPRHMV